MKKMNSLEEAVKYMATNAYEKKLYEQRTGKSFEKMIANFKKLFAIRYLKDFSYDESNEYFRYKVTNLNTVKNSKNPTLGENHCLIIWN